MRWPGLGALFVLSQVAIWAVVTGIVNIVHAITGRELTEPLFYQAMMHLAS